MATAIVESTPTTSVLSQMETKSKKRTRDQLIVYDSEEIEIANGTELVATKKCKLFASTRITTNLQITKQTKECVVELNCIENEMLLQNILEFCPLESFTHGKISDFCYMDYLLAYKNYTSDSDTLFTVPTFELIGKTEDSKILLAYLKGLLQRKTEVAVIPIPNSKYQLLLFDRDSFSATTENTTEIFNFECNLQCILIEKFKFVLDLDETLVRTRFAHIEANEENSFLNTTAYPIRVNGQSFVTTIRPGTSALLKWLSQIFQVYVFTNGIYSYAVEVCKLLDPTNETILKQVHPTNTKEWRLSFLKAREDMTNVCNQSGLGIKDLQKHNLNIFETVALDDDSSVWKNKENLLDFEAVTKPSQQSEQDLFYRVRNETWMKLKLLLKVKAKYRQRIHSVPTRAVLPEKPATFSQEVAQSE